MKKNLSLVLALLGVVLCFLKGAGIAFQTWSWWIVTAPLWAPPVAFVIFMIVIGIIIIIRGGVDRVAQGVFKREDN